MMTNEKPKVALDGRYTQADVSRVLGIDRHTVLSYERQGLLKFRIRKAGKRKVTTGAEIVKCWTNCFM